MGDRVPDEFRGDEAGVVDLAFVPLGVAAVDGSAGEVDDGVCAVEGVGPGAGGLAVPAEVADVRAGIGRWGGA